MQEQYKDFWISGHSITGYPGAHNSTPVASVLYHRPDNSVVDLTTLDVHNFAFEDHEVGELFGLELARLMWTLAILNFCASGRKWSKGRTTKF